MKLGIALLLSSALAAQGGLCTPNIYAWGADIPPVNGLGVETDITYSSQPSTTECGACTFAWQVEVEWEYPWPMPPGSVVICAGGGGSLFCSDAVVEDTTGPNPPPYTYYFESVTNDFMLACPGRLQLSLEWNPGLGFITIVQINLECNGC